MGGESGEGGTDELIRSRKSDKSGREMRPMK